MSIPNRITLDDISGMEIGAIAALPVEHLAQLTGEAREALERAKRVKDWIDGAIDLKYGARATEARRQAGKDTGTVRLADGDHVVIADLPKKVRWDQGRLAALVAEIRAGGDDPAEYVCTEYTVSERAYGAWPSSISAAFAPARTIEAGKPSYRIEIKETM